MSVQAVRESTLSRKERTVRATKTLAQSGRALNSTYRPEPIRVSVVLASNHVERKESRWQKAKNAGEAAIVRVLAPICADKFRQASDSAAKLTALKGTDSWKRDDFIKDTGYATFPGSEYDRKVADACVELLTQVKG